MPTLSDHARAADGSDDRRGNRILRALADELDRRGVTPEEIGRLSRISMWQGVTKNADGEAETHDLYGFRLSPTWDDGPQWPTVQPGPVVNVKGAQRPTPTTGTDTRIVVFPDMQIGYYRDRAGELVAVHDEQAIEVALQVAAAVKPDRIIALGDNLDLPEMSRYRLSPAFQLTTQAAVDYATVLFARIATLAPTVEWLAGNHEERLSNWLMDNARAAFGLRQGATTEGWPVLSVPHLCRLDEAGVVYRPGYPASDVWVTENLRIIHGNRVKSKGSTAHVYLNESKTSVIYGHIHRIERAHRTRQDHDGPTEIMAASPGCLARIDGAVPSTGQGLDLDGRPLPRAEDWQQGIAVITVHDGNLWEYEQVRISDGVALWRGKRYEAA
jgi:hypothetical protein